MPKVLQSRDWPLLGVVLVCFGVLVFFDVVAAVYVIGCHSGATNMTDN